MKLFALSARSIIAWSSVWFASHLSIFAEENPTFHLVEGDQGVTVLEGIRPVLTYQRAVQSKHGRWPRSNYVHPVYDLDGEVLTEDFPPDHGHHRGIFWAWHQVRIDGQPMGDAWECRDFEWDVLAVTSYVNRRRAHIRATTHWKSPTYAADDGSLIPFVLEHTLLTVYPCREVAGSKAVSDRSGSDEQANRAPKPGQGSHDESNSGGRYRFIDFDIRLSALVTGLELGGSDDVKGYGGFSPRIKLNGEEAFRAAEGEVEPINTQLHAGAWVDISDERRGVTILTHPSNPGFPTPWILRRERSMQNAAYPGREPILLPIDRDLRLRYRLVLHEGALDLAQFSAWQTQYASEN